MVLSQQCLHKAKTNLFPYNQLTVCQPGKMPFRLRFRVSSSYYHSTLQQLTSLLRGCRGQLTGCWISSLPKHFMLSSVTANWWASRGSKHTCLYTSMYAHTHIWVCVVASRSLPGLGPVPGSVLGSPQNKEQLCSRVCCTGFSQCSPSAPQTIPIVLLFNEEESTWLSHFLGPMYQCRRWMDPCVSRKVKSHARRRPVKTQTVFLSKQQPANRMQYLQMFGTPDNYNSSISL